MRSKVFALVGLLIVGLASACGGGLDAAERVAACERDFAAGLLDRQPALPGRVAAQTAQRFCRATGGRDEKLSNTAYFGFLRDNPSVLQPLCVAMFEAELGLNGRTIRALGLRKDLDTLGRSYCNRATEAGLFQLDQPPTELEIGQVYQAHPALGKQACFVAGMAAIAGDAPTGPELTYSKKFWRRYCSALVEEDLTEWDGQPLTRAETRRIRVICGRVTSELTRGRVKSC
jgi:hypothetical protein